MIKLNGTIVVGSELTNGNKILNEVRGNQNIIKSELMREQGRASRGNREQAPIADNNGRER